METQTEKVRFAVRHKDSLSQESVKNTLRERGCQVTFVNWANGITVAEAPREVAEKVKEWLFRVMIAYDGKKYKAGRDPTQNKVKRMEASPETFYTPTMSGTPMEVTEKHLWKCMSPGCGRVWRFRRDAQTCQHKDEIERMVSTWIAPQSPREQGYFARVPKTFKCIRREEAKQA